MIATTPSGPATRTEIVTGYRPGAIGGITTLHSAYYARSWGLGLSFEAEVASELAEFFSRYDKARDRVWLVLSGGGICGSIAVDGSRPQSDGESAQLRWFILGEGQRGHGLGDELMNRAMAFCRASAFPRVFLITFDGLDPARRLYERNGFRLTDERMASNWGRQLKEQLFEWRPVV